MDPASLIEANSESLSLRLDHLILSSSDFAKSIVDDPEKFKVVQDFVTWCLAEDQKDLDEPRAPDGKSFRERRVVDPEWWIELKRIGGSREKLEAVLAKIGLP